MPPIGLRLGWLRGLPASAPERRRRAVAAWPGAAPGVPGAERPTSAGSRPAPNPPTTRTFCARSTARSMPAALTLDVVLVHQHDLERRRHRQRLRLTGHHLVEERLDARRGETLALGRRLARCRRATSDRCAAPATLMRDRLHEVAVQAGDSSGVEPDLRAVGALEEHLALRHAASTYGVTSESGALLDLLRSAARRADRSSMTEREVAGGELAALHVAMTSLVVAMRDGILRDRLRDRRRRCP